MRYLKLTLSLLALCCVVVGASSCNDAMARELDMKLSVFNCPEDATMGCATLSWKAKGDAGGMPTAHNVVWRLGTASSAPIRTATVPMPRAIDTVRFTRAPLGDSVQLLASLTAVRRGRTSPAVNVSAWAVTPDAAPPPPDSVKIDTLDVAAGLDTTNIFTLADGTVRPTIAAVDSMFDPSRIHVRRAEGDLYIVGIGYAPSFVADHKNAVLIYGPPPPCVSDTGGDWHAGPPHALIRWTGSATGLPTPGDPNTLYPRRAVLARIAQLPVDSLREYALRSLAEFTRADTLEPWKRETFEQCYGPLPPGVT